MDSWVLGLYSNARGKAQWGWPTPKYHCVDQKPPERNLVTSGAGRGVDCKGSGRRKIYHPILSEAGLKGKAMESLMIAS